MNYVGILIGLATFLIIGLFHPLVIKGRILFRNPMLVGFPRDGNPMCRFVPLCGKRVLEYYFRCHIVLFLLGDTRSVRPTQTGTERLVPEKSQTTERLRINRPSFLYYSHSLPSLASKIFPAEKKASPSFYIPLFQALEYSKNMRQMKNHSPEIDFSFLQTIFRLPQDDKSLSHKPFFLSNLPIYPKEQSHCYILPCHTQTTDGTFTNPVKPDIQLHEIFLPDMLRHPD